VNWNDTFMCPNCGKLSYFYLKLRGELQYDQPLTCKKCGSMFVLRTTIKRTCHEILPCK